MVQPLGSLLFVVADVLRERLKGNEVTYGVVRNINYTSETSDLVTGVISIVVSVMSLLPNTDAKTRGQVWCMHLPACI